MFKRTKEKIQKMISDTAIELVSDHTRRFYHTEPGYKTCEICGCLVNPARAIKGDSIVKLEDVIQPCSVGSCKTTRETIHTQYYCLIHAPKDLEIKKRSVEELYNELIMEVSNKSPHESRHETARRYIRERENSSNNSCAKES